MITSVERYSPAMGRRRAGVFGGRLVRGIVIALLLYLVVSRFFAATFRVESVSMEPSLAPSDRVIVSYLAYGPRIPFSSSRFPGLGEPARGDIVVVQPPFYQEMSFLQRVFEPVVSFFTGQKATLRRDLFGARVNAYMVKRVVGVPGDTLRMSGYTVSIRPRGATVFVAEAVLVPGFQAQAAPRVEGWDDTLPLSGTIAERILADGEYFVLGDNRTKSSDSRSWGPVKRDRIVGKVVFRYWPPGSFGEP
jgi:signal peptidase I